MVATPLFALAGLGVSVYLTIAHYTQLPLAACPENATINCEKVTTSPESVVFGVPVALLGLLFFAAMVPLCLPFAWRCAHRLVAPARLAAVVVGIGFVCYLLYAELFDIRSICLYCTSVHVLTFALFVGVVTGWDEARAPYLEALEAA